MATFKSNDNVRVAVKDNGKWKLIWVKESDLKISVMTVKFRKTLTLCGMKKQSAGEKCQ